MYEVDDPLMGQHLVLRHGSDGMVGPDPVSSNAYSLCRHSKYLVVNRNLVRKLLVYSDTDIDL